MLRFTIKESAENGRTEMARTFGLNDGLDNQRHGAITTWRVSVLAMQLLD